MRLPMIVLVLLTTPLAFARSASTTFPSTENPIATQGGTWINGGTTGLGWNNVRTTPGLAFGTQPGNASGSAVFADSTAVLSGSWGPNQTVTGTVRVISANNTNGTYEEVELRLRTTITANSITGYEINCSVSTASDGNYLQVVRWNGALGSFTQINSTGAACHDGDIIQASITGNQITVKKNGTTMFGGPQTDSTFATGAPGIGFFLQNGSSALNANYGLSSWSADDGVGPPTVATPVASPPGGGYTTGQVVSLSTTTPGATICWTADGSTPTSNGAGTCTHGTTYTTTIAVNSTQTIKALASLAGDTDSSVASFAYTIAPPGSTVTATSCSNANVQTAINSTGATGWTVIVPAGSCTWSSNVTISGKGLTLVGAGTGSTNITGGSGTGDLIITNLDGTHFVDVSGFTFNTHDSNGIIQLHSTGVMAAANGFRIHHLTIASATAGARGIEPVGIWGLIDHVTFSVTDSSGSDQMISIFGSDDSSDGGFTPWTLPETLGTANAVYVEDNSFTSASPFEDIIDAYGGARFVIRHNTFTNSHIGFHGFDSGDRRSPFSFEIYNNTFTNNTSTQFRASTIRGGTGVIFSNTYGGSHAWDGQTLMVYRACPTLDQSAWGTCASTNWEIGSTNFAAQASRTSSTNGGVKFCSGNRDLVCTTDANCSGGGFGTCSTFVDGSGSGNYACRDQPGRTHGQLLDPVYAWANSANGAIGTYNGGFSCGLGLNNYLQAGRDYVDNGTANTPKPGYTAYTYPNPLQGGGSGIQLTSTNWSLCFLPGCNPGGSGTPTSVTQTFGPSSVFTLQGPANSNALAIYKLSGSSTATNFSSDFNVTVNSTNANSYEFDMFKFTAGTEYMFGTQCNFPVGFWQVWRQDTSTWVTTSLACTLTAGPIHHIQETDHICGGQMCYDSITIDGVTTNWNLVEPAGPTAFADAIGIQFQSDENGSGTTLTQTLQNVLFTPTTVTAPVATISPSSLAFGNQGTGTTSAPQNITLQNTGTATLNITSIAKSGANPGSYGLTNGCSVTLGIGLSCTVAMTFSPSSATSLPASVTFTTNDPINPTQVIPMTGTGIVPTAKPCLQFQGGLILRGGIRTQCH